MKNILRKSRYYLFLTLLAFIVSLVKPHSVDALREVNTFGTFGIGAGQLQNPYGLAVDEGNGFIYVADTVNHRIQVFSIFGDYITFFGESGSADGQFRHPQGVGVDASGNVYVVGTVYSRIQKFIYDGVSYTFAMKFGSRGSGNDQFFLPRDISLDSAGNIYVCDSGNDRVLKFNSSGVWQATIGAGDLFNPYGIDVDDSGNIYVADTENHRIIKYDPNGTILMQFGSYGTGPGEFRHPHDVAVDGNGNIFVADTNNYRIQRFDPSGEYIYSIGRFVEYISPQKVVVDGSQRLYTIDSNTNQVRIYDVRDFFTNIYAEPSTFSPDGDGIYDVTNIHYTIPEPAHITIAIYDESNTLVRTLLSDVERVSPNNVEVWDGLKDDLVTYAEEGYYTCKLNARASGNYRPPQQRIDVRVHYPLGQISGVVTDGFDPLEGATVTAGVHSSITDAFGEYTITNLPPYGFNVIVSKAGCSEATRFVTLGEDELVTGINFELGCYQVTGVVTDGIDPLEGVLIAAENMSDFTDTAGQYTLVNLISGIHTLTAKKAGCIVSSQAISVDRTQPTATANFTLDCSLQPDIRVYPESLSFTVTASSEFIDPPPLSPQSNKDYEIKLKSRRFIPEEGEVALRPERRRKEKIHTIVQLYRVPDKNEKEDLKQLGLKILSYLPNNSWFSTIRPAGLNKIKAHPLIRWIGDLRPEDKLSPRIKEKGVPGWARQEDGRVEVVVKFFDDVEITEIDDMVAKIGGDIKERYNLTNAVRVVITQEAIQTLSGEDIVQWIEESPPPFKPFNDGARASVNVDTVQSAPYELSGLGIVVGIWNSGHVDADHDDFTGRVTFGDTAEVRSHATHVAGTIGGDGALSWQKGGAPYQWRGMAPAVQILSYDWNNSIDEYSSAINIYNISISNNSWGFDIDEAKYDNCSLYGDYPVFVAEYDGIARGGDGKPIMIVFSAGNDRNDLDCGFVSPDVGYGTVPPPATGKNILAVGAINSDTDSMTVFSAWGPVDDGRIKPELVAPGCEEGGEGYIKSTLPGDQYGGPGYCGTSMSAPVASGIAALIMERFKNNYGSDPLPSTVKAYMVHTAVDLDTAGPDYRTGYGKINALAAINAVDSPQFVEEQLEISGQEDTYLITVPEGAAEFKATLVWDDLPGAPNSPPELINDLDLIVTDPDGTIHAPWLLDSGNPSLAAGRGEDNLNTIEQVYVQSPVAGIWSVKVQGAFLAEPQSYSLVTKNIGTVKQSILTVYNDGVIDLHISDISKSQDWLNVSPVGSLTISTGGAKILNVSVSTKALPAGLHTDTINISSDDPDEGLVSVPVSFTYIDTVAPIVSEVRSSVGSDTDNEYPINSFVRIEIIEQNGEEGLTGTINITGELEDPGIIDEPLTDEGEGVYVYMWDTQGRLGGDYYVEVTLMDASGNEDSDGLPVTPDLTITLSPITPPILGAFPSLDPQDGKFISIVGQGIATIDVPLLTLFIAVDRYAATFTVDIFDGDVGNHYDTSLDTPANSYFTLYADPLKNGEGMEIISQKIDDLFSDNTWVTLFEGPPHDTARAPSGYYFYRLEATLGDDPQNPDPTPATINGFKVRATGLVSIVYGPFQIIGGDTTGCTGSNYRWFSNGIDTTYNCAWEFLMNIPEWVDQINLTDADADHLLDDTPGVANGANDIIKYEVVDPEGTTIFVNNNPSGNYDVLAGDFDIETNTVPTGNVGGLFRWRWLDLWTENNIHLQPPSGSPITFEMWAAEGVVDEGALLEAPRVSSAKSMGYYKQAKRDLTPLLPVLLGRIDTNGNLIGSSIIVSNNEQAKEILNRGEYMERGPRAVNKLMSQLITTKFNIKNAVDLGEPLEEAYIIGTDLQVFTMVSCADDLLAAVEDPALLTNAEIVELNETQDILDMVNNGMVTYVSPETSSASLTHRQTPSSINPYGERGLSPYLKPQL